MSKFEPGITYQNIHNSTIKLLIIETSDIDSEPDICYCKFKDNRFKGLEIHETFLKFSEYRKYVSSDDSK